MHWFLKFILGMKLCGCFGQFLCPSSEVFHCTHSSGICHTGLLTACEQDQDGTPWSCSQAVNKPVWHIPLLCVQWKTPYDRQRNCPKHVDFHSKKKFEKFSAFNWFYCKKSPLKLMCTIVWKPLEYVICKAAWKQNIFLWPVSSACQTITYKHNTSISQGHSYD